VYGRVVHLNPVVWSEDWPLMGERRPGSTKQEPVLRHPKPDLPAQPIAIPQTSDEFDLDVLSPAWQWHANHSKDWYSLTTRPGHLRLLPVFAPGLDLWRAPSLLLQKLPAPAFQLETELELSGTEGKSRSGLVVMGESHAALAVTERALGQTLELFVDGRSVYSVELPATAVRLRLSFAPGGLCRFEYSASGQPTTRIEATFQARRGRWIGAKVGLFSVCELRDGAPGHADFAYFRFAPGAL
jgi:beta-xylosidase